VSQYNFSIVHVLHSPAGTRAPITTAIAAVPGSGLNHFISDAANSIVYIFSAQFKQFLMTWLIISFVAFSRLKHRGSNDFRILPTNTTTNNLYGPSSPKH
jgi:hypothetical protein